MSNTAYAHFLVIKLSSGLMPVKENPKKDQIFTWSSVHIKLEHSKMNFRKREKNPIIDGRY